VARITKPVDERRQEILDTAKYLFIENGYDKMQVSDISKKMNVAQGLIYHYFKSKVDILYAVIDELAEAHIKTVEGVLEKCDGSALERLTLFFNNSRNWSQYEKLNSSFASDRAIIDYCIKKMAIVVIPRLHSLIEKGNADGSWSCEYPKETSAFILHGMIGVFDITSFSRPEENKMREFMDIVYRVLNVVTF
jgi:AcrR family transcriptional regulator